MSEMPAANLKEKYEPRVLKEYRDNIIAKMKDRFRYSNIMSVPKIKKIVLNMGVGTAVADPKIIEKVARDLKYISGQAPKITRAKKPISNFKIRKGLAIGCCVTLRRYRMYEFLDRLITIAMPRIRDFRGFSPDGFDGRGNYNFGIVEQTIFPEVDVDRLEKTQGMNITICTSAKTDEEARELLRLFGFPFRR